MEISLRVDEATDVPQAVWSLEDWLRNEPGLQRRVRRAPATPSSEELGGVVDTLQVALGAGGTIAVLAAALQTWFAQPRRSDVVITITGGGESVTVDAKRVADVPGLLEEVAKLRGTDTDASA